MVEKVRCEHCGAECKRPVTKVIDGRTLNFCCSGCLQVYELLREEGPQAGQGSPAVPPSASGRLGVQPGTGAGLSTKTVLLPIVGMTCANCVAQVERGLRAVPGVVQVSVNLQDELATVRFDAQKATVDRLASAVRNVGYDVGHGGAAETTGGFA